MDTDETRRKRLNRGVIGGGVCCGVAAFFLWAHLSHGPFWLAFVASGVVAAGYCVWAYDTIGMVKRAECPDTDRYWREVSRILSVFNGTLAVTAFAVSMLILAARSF